MIILIATVTIILYIILIAFIIHNLSSVADVKVKVGYIVIGLVVLLICTFIAFCISSIGINFENANIIGKIRNMMLAVFVPVNGLIVMPYLASLLSKIGNNEITQEEFKKKIVILCVIFLVVFIFECSYFKNTQMGILKMITQK